MYDLTCAWDRLMGMTAIREEMSNELPITEAVWSRIV